MTQTDTFNLRISPQDKNRLAKIASHYERSQADVIRFIIRREFETLAQQRQVIAKSQPATKAQPEPA